MRRRDGRTGSALIEAAFVLPALMFLVFGSVDIARTLHTTQIVATAARSGAHQALRNTDLAAIESAAATDGASAGVKAHATRLCACSIDVQTGSCEAVRCATSRVAYVHVETQAEVKPFVRLPGLVAPFEVNGSAWVRVE